MHHDDVLARGRFDTAPVRRTEPEIALVHDQARTAEAVRASPDERARSIAAPVIDDDNLCVEIERRERRRHILERGEDVAGLIVRRDHDRE